MAKKTPNIVRDDSPGEPVDLDLLTPTDVPPPEAPPPAPPVEAKPQEPEAPVKVPTSTGSPKPIRFKVLADIRLGWRGQFIHLKKDQVFGLERYGRDGLDALVKAGLKVEQLP